MQFLVRRQGPYLRITRTDGRLIKLMPISPSALTPITVSPPRRQLIHTKVGDQSVVFVTDSQATADTLRAVLCIA